MDLPSVHDTRLRDTRKTNKMKKKQVKVVYISTPLKVKTSASKFMSLVQELTGKDSDIYELVETSKGNYLDCSDESPPESTRESPTSSGSILEPRFDDNMDGLFVAGAYNLEDGNLCGINFQQDLSFGNFDHLLWAPSV